MPINRCKICDTAINYRRRPGVFCSGPCGSWFHVACCVNPISRERLDDTLVNGTWRCHSCLPLDASVSGDVSSVSSGAVTDAVYARLDRLEAKVDALQMENAHLRSELELCQSMRAEIQSLEYRLDALTFWGMSPARPAGAGAPRVSNGGSFILNGFGNFSGHPSRTSSPVPVLPRPAPRSSLLKDVLTRTFIAPNGAGLAAGSSSEDALVTPTIFPGSAPGAPVNLNSNSGDLSPPNSVTTIQTVAEIHRVDSSANNAVCPDSVPAGFRNGALPPGGESAVRGEGGAGALPLSGEAATLIDGGRVAPTFRRKNERPVVIGCAKRDNPLPAVPARPAYRWLFVSRLSRVVTADMLSDFLSSRLRSKRRPRCVGLVPESNTTRRVASFRVELLPDEFEEALCGDFWDEGILVKRFVFFRQSSGRERRGVPERSAANDEPSI